MHLLYPFFLGTESSRQHRQQYSNRGRYSGYINEEIVSMEMESATWSLPERITAATGCRSERETEIV